jgi:Cu(I)/Ag(I) efflux system membrane fusion protein
MTPSTRAEKIASLVRWGLVVASALLALFAFLVIGRRGPDADPNVVYQCPMHLQIVRDEPGTCPICHMALEPVPRDRLNHGSAEDGGPDEDGRERPPLTVDVELSEERARAIGIRVVAVKEEVLAGDLRVTASVAVDERGEARVHVRSAGFVEKLFVQQTGVRVRAGQPLAAVYSPEILAAQNELLTVRRFSDEGAARTLESARAKLELLGMTRAQIAEVEARGEAVRAVTLVSPTDGHVVTKNAVLGAYVTPETALFVVQDLARVYVVADVFARDAERVRIGSEATFVPSRAGVAAVRGTVDLIYPLASLDARTTRVRMTVPNGKLLLRPGDFGRLEVAGPSEKALLVPRDAVVDTGARAYVYVVRGEGRYRPVVVELGGAQGGDVVVRRGLSPGERVVSGATFLLDAESRIRGAAMATLPESRDVHDADAGSVHEHGHGVLEAGR